MINEQKRIRMITGHYGSGKTEFAVNYTLALAATGAKTAIVDLDIVNPYFRSRERADLLEANGVRVISSSIAGMDLDIPALSSEIFAVLQDDSYEGVFDVGGDKVGARALGRYHMYLDKQPYDMMFVLNANRPRTATVEGAKTYIKEIEEASRQKVTCLVNNTHLCGDTTAEEIMKGNRLCVAVSKELGIPLTYNVVPKDLLDKIPSSIEGEIFPIDILMKKPWA